MFRNLLIASTLLVATTLAYSEYRPFIATRLAKAIMQNPDIAPEESDEEICDGSGFITHGDGHRTPCPGCKACQKNEPVNNDVCQCGCGQEGCTCQAQGKFGQCTCGKEAPATEEGEAEVEVLPAPAGEQEPVAEAKSSDLMVYHFGAEWCPPCVKMKQTTWKDATLMKWMADKGIQFNKFDADTPAHKEYFDYYRIVELPTILVVDRDSANSPKRQLVGFFSANTMLRILKEEVANE